MKKILASMACAVCLFSEMQAQSYTGVTSLETQTLQDASFVGPTQLKEIKAKAISVIGPLSGNDVICTKLNVTGPADMTGLQVAGDSVIIGPLKANQSTFEELMITADEVILKDTKSEDILIKKNKDQNKEQVLHLKGKTQVIGDIIFESGKGIIKQDAGVKIQGKVKGAKIDTK